MVRSRLPLAIIVVNKVLVTEFYQVFWSLQLPFSKPNAFAEQMTFASFKESVTKVLPVIKEATAKERALMGSKANNGGSSSLKRKRDVEINFEPQGQEYFFAKYLTSPDLLDLEVRKTLLRACRKANKSHRLQIPTFADNSSSSCSSS